jgi:hypothetical protein
MSYISINRIGDSITGSYGNTNFGVSFNEERWSKMQELEEASLNASSVDEINQILEDFAELAKEDFKTIIESEYPNIYVNKATGQFHLKVGDKVSSVAMPKSFVERIKDSIDKGIDPEPLIKFWTRWLRNPVLRRKNTASQLDFSDRVVNYVNALFMDDEVKEQLVEEHGITPDLAEERAKVLQVKITKEGLLCTYKVSTEVTEKFALDEDGNPITVSRYNKVIDPDTGIVSYDEPEHVEKRVFKPALMGDSGDAFYCEGDNGYEDPGHFIKVGCTHRLPDWSYVNTNNDASCVKGLHVGGLSYIRGYQTGDRVTHNVFIDPMHIGAIPNCHTDGDGALRCLQYFVHSSFAGVNGSIYHSSEYAALTDAQWIKMREEIIKEFGELEEVREDELNELNAL